MYINSLVTCLGYCFKQPSLQKPPKNTSSAQHTDEFENTTTTTNSESLKLHSDYLRNILNFLNKKNALFLKETSKNLNNEVAQILNETHYPKTLPKKLNLDGIEMIQEAKQNAPSTQRLVKLMNNKLQWAPEFIIYCLEKNKSTDGYNEYKQYLLHGSILSGDITLLNSLKQDIGFTADDARANNNFALRRSAQNGHVEVLRFLKNESGLTTEDARAQDNWALVSAAQNGHVEVLRFLKDEFGLTANDARANNSSALIWAAENRHLEVLRFLKDEFEFTANDARTHDNTALRWATANGHVEVIKFFENEWGLTLS